MVFMSLKFVPVFAQQATSGTAYGAGQIAGYCLLGLIVLAVLFKVLRRK